MYLKCASVYSLCTTQVVRWCAGTVSRSLAVGKISGGCLKKKKNSTAEKHTLHSQCSPGADNNRIDFATIATRWGCIGQENIVN